MPMPGKCNRLRLIAAAALALAAPPAAAQTRDAPPPPATERLGLDSLFGANMVLQRGRPIAIWGRAAPGERVAVSLGDKRAEAVTGADGVWRTRLSARHAGGPYRLDASAPSFHDRYDNVMVGDVWLCAGQSNMEFRRSKAVDLDQRFAPDAGLRMLDVARQQASAPSPHLMTLGGWSRSAPATAANFSAVCHHFGQRLRAALGVPVGLIDAAWGGTQIAAFVDEATLTSRELAPAIADPASRQNGGHVFNGMIAPLAPFALRGVLWYQGESDTHRPEAYGARLAALAASWRTAFAQPLPFVVIQLPAFDPAPKDPSGHWAVVREAQRRFAANDEKARLVVQIDQGSAHQLHPPQKAVVAERAAATALADVYRSGGAAGPRATTISRTKTAIRIGFEIKGGLTARNGPAVNGFELCDTVCAPVAARITGARKVELAIPPGTDPRSIRYAWADVPVPALFDRAGWPVGPFEATIPKQGKAKID
jgi:sialate O-acetylesterase